MRTALRTVRVGLVAALLLTACRAQTAGDAATWPFAPGPDEFSPQALLDLRALNEPVAGESGFVTVGPDGDFRLGNGQPVRFWAVNTSVARRLPYEPRPLWRRSAPDLARHARFLAKRGVNLVRCHAHVNPDPQQALTDLNQAERDWIWRTVAAMKKEGIYTVISPYWAVPAKLGESWGIPGGTQQSALGLLFFDETLQRGYRAWLKALYAEPNPHTGVPLAQDPAVAVIQLQNEDSLLFWTINGLKGEQRVNLGRRFGAWAKQQYGSLDAAYRAWQGDRLPGDDLAAGVLDFHNVWEMTQTRSGGRAKRLDDQLQFWTATMVAFNRETAEYLRGELGCRQLINAGNWRTADNVRLFDAERYSYSVNDVQAVNRYFGGLHVGPNQGWAIVEGDQFTSPSVLLDPLALPINLKQVAGQPMMVTESAWVFPNGCAVEGPFLIAAYQSLTGVDAYFWFATGDDEWTPPQSANGYLKSQQKWLFGNPEMLGTFPAAALLYRRGDLRRGEPVVAEERSLTDLWQRRTPVIWEESGFDPNRDAGNLAPTSAVKQPVPQEAFLAGPVQVKYDGDAAQTKVADLTPYLDPAAKRVRSVTGELELDWARGFCRIDSPRAQGVAAHFRNQRQFTLSDVELTCANDFGTVLVVALDDQPLKTSTRVLVQVGMPARPTGWRQSPTTIKVKEGSFEGYRVDSFGQAPWAVVQPRVDLLVKNPGLSRATVLDPNGNAVGEAPVTREATGLRISFPPNALYVVLR